MTDRLTAAQRSALMSRIRGRDTFPERALRERLRRRNVAYRSNLPVNGIRVDIAFPGVKTALMVHGCFWHGCRWHYIAPRSNVEFWRKKIDENRARDRRQSSALRAAGWRVVTVWEHSVRADPDGVVGRLITLYDLKRYGSRRVKVAGRRKVIRGRRGPMSRERNRGSNRTLIWKPMVKGGT
jgi:DNA mismatch endonuclease (patch repair protein)